MYFMKRCASCDKNINKDSGKLLGTIIKVKDENGKIIFVHVCSDCMKDKEWVERAVVRAA